MKSVFALTLSALVALTLLAGCSQPMDGDIVSAAARPAAATDTGPDQNLADAVNDFGFDLARRLLTNSDNTVISPLSVHAALSMTAMGARTTTAKEMTTVLRLDSVEGDTNGWGYANLLGELYEPESATLEIVNSLWAQQNAPFEQEFLDANRDYFGAEIRTLDLQASGAADEINDWVATKTHDRITEIIDAPSDNAVMELVNAVYFLADWAEPFEANSTQPTPFTLADGEQIDVDMMYALREWDYGESDTLQIVRLPYAAQEFAAYVIVPRGELAPADILETMDATMWKSLARQMMPKEGSVAIPRLEVEWGEGVDLGGPLANMGMPSAFTFATADFSGISAELNADPGLEISRVLHKTYLRVDETGSEAAAATDVEVTLGATVGGAFDPFELRADRPFIFTIVDETSGTLLFLGVIENPTM